MQRFLTVLALCAAIVFLHNPPVAAARADDKEALKGDWKGVQNGVVFRCTFGEGFTFAAEGGNVKLDAKNLGYSLQEEGSKRHIELDRRGAELADIPHIIPYRIEGDTLQVTFSQGALRGIWKLKREKK